MNTIPLIETRHLKKYFHVSAGELRAVDDVSLTINQGMTLGVVGESGCGKSTLGRTMLQLIPATSGEILYNGENIARYSPKQRRALCKDLQIIFQDPYSSINPRMTVFEIIAEYMFVNKTYKTRQEIWNHTAELMDTVGLARRLAGSYPHELDGGRRQRIGVARALSLNPKFIVCDEPVSALDVSIQAQILNLLMDLQRDRGLTYMFIPTTCPWSGISPTRSPLCIWDSVWKRLPQRSFSAIRCIRIPKRCFPPFRFPAVVCATRRFRSSRER
jgi:peptide/nickel transport system ATP-binding protein